MKNWKEEEGVMEQEDEEFELGRRKGTGRQNTVLLFYRQKTEEMRKPSYCEKLNLEERVLVCVTEDCQGLTRVFLVVRCKWR